MRYHPEDIKAAVRKTGTTLTQLALDHDLNEDACRDALRNRRPKADKIISKYLGIPLHKLWPTRYLRNGQLIKSTKRETYNTNADCRQRLNDEAA